MSIINDALKKTEGVLEPYKRPRNLRKVWFGIGALGFLSILFINNLTQTQKGQSGRGAPQPQSYKIESNDANAPGKTANQIDRTSGSRDITAFKLEGVVSGRGEPYAIVENNILKEGDSIRGIKIVKISTNSIKVAYDNKEYDLNLE